MGAHGTKQTHHSIRQHVIEEAMKLWMQLIMMM